MPFPDLTLADLLDPEDADAVEEYLFEQLALAGFPTTAWGDTDVGTALVKGEAAAIADLLALTSTAAQGVLLARSSGAWLDQLAQNFFNLTREPAVTAVGRLRLQCAAGAGPYTLTAHQLWATPTSGGAAGLKFNSTNPGGEVLASGGTLDLDFAAEAPGADYNATFGTAFALVTALPGVTVVQVDLGGGTWLSTPGVDTEPDAKLRERCTDQWATLAVGTGPKAAYVKWAEDASPSITKVYVDDTNALGTGTVGVWVAGDGTTVPDGAGSPTQAARDAIAKVQPLTAAVVVAPATGHTVNVGATLYVRGTGDATAIGTAAQDAVRAYLQGLDLGATVYLSELIALISDAGGAATRNVVVATPGADVPLGGTPPTIEVAVPGALTVAVVFV